MGFQTCTINHNKVIKLKRNILLGRGMDLNSLTWLLVTYVLFQMYTTKKIKSHFSFIYTFKKGQIESFPWDPKEWKWDEFS